MTIEEIERWFEDDENSREFIKFERIVNPVHQRPDLCAFLMLDAIAPNPGRDLVSWAGHDEIALDFDVEANADKLTPDTLLTLHRCGVRFDGEGFRMFV